MRRCSLVRHRRPSGVESHSLTAVGSLLTLSILPERAITVQCTRSRSGTFYPCATHDPRYDTAITRNRLRRSMHNNNNRLRRSSRSPVILFPFAVSALVSACQSVGPSAGRSAGSGRRRHGRSRSARADRAAGARVPRARRRARLARAPALAVYARDRTRPRRATRTRLVRAQPGVPRPRLQAGRPLSVPYRRRARGARHAGRARAAADRRKRVRSVRVFARPRGRVCGRSFPAPASDWASRRTGGSTAGATCSNRRAPRSTTCEQLHEQFDGDWLLAVAGYNSGEGNVARALKKAAAAGQAAGFLGHQELPAGRNAHLRAAPARASRRSSAIRPRTASRCPSCATKRSSPSSKPAARSTWRSRRELAGIDTDALYALNPGINRWATDPEGPHRLLLPLEQAELFTTSLAALGERELVQWTRHRVRAGETIGGIAERYQTTRRGAARDQRAARQFDPRRRLSDDPARQRSRSQATRRAPMPVRLGNRARRATASGASTSFKPASRSGRSRARTTSMCAASRAGTRWRRATCSASGASSSSGPTPPAQIAVGAMAQASLAALGFGRRASRRPTAFARSRTSCAAATRLSSIARRFKVSVGKLVEWNAGAADKYLQPGQRLKMFVDVTEQSG